MFISHGTTGALIWGRCEYIFTPKTSKAPDWSYGEAPREPHCTASASSGPRVAVGHRRTGPGPLDTEPVRTT